MSASHLPLLFGIVAVTHYGNGAYSCFQFFPFVGRKIEVQRVQVLFQMRQLGGAWNRHNPRSLMQKAMRVQPALTSCCVCAQTAAVR